tara:strand:- start:4726 stop:5490 length:765 start_codon:yes stop_codon:yes gene_type:complete
LKKKSTLVQSLLILLISVVLVALYGVIPLPDYNTEINNEIEGAIYYLVDIQSSNLIPPAPDILDECIFKIDISITKIKETKVICTSDLYQYSSDIYLNDSEIDENQNIVIRYYDNVLNSQMALIIDTKSNVTSKSKIESLSTNQSMYELNSRGERLLSRWDMQDTSARSAGIYYQKNSTIVEVFSIEAPTNYYFESVKWAQDGESIVALDTENDIIIFSKNKMFDPIKLIIDNYYSSEIEGDERVIYQLIGWSN